ncbi:MAG: squalene/phytoene synthase family protein, partial [Alphaproteobacteria bacterium]|nr:squalene/phytoene synthase family protein [Alphaproteobacteria bacterium]
MTPDEAEAHLFDRLRRRDPDRFFAASFSPAPVRARLLALYGLHHELADIAETVREPMIGQIRLAWWREALPAIGAGEPPGHPVAIALAEALRPEGLAGVLLPRLEALVEARAEALEAEPPDTLEALAGRVEAEAGTLAEAATCL